MENLLGKIEASLIEKDQSLSDDLIDRINENISPLRKVQAGDVYVRAMYIASDRVNSFGGRFPADEHPHLMELIIDSPVLVGHRKDSLPIARNFHSERVQKDGANWIKVYFYWLRGSEKAENLKNNIDGGIYKECSISFIFGFPECSICGDDIRRCGHRPFTKYRAPDGTKKEAYFNYRQIDKVLETSLVYRGSVQDTSLTDELFFHTGRNGTAAAGVKKEIRHRFKRVWNIETLQPDQKYAIMPAYESIRLIVMVDDDSINLYYYDDRPLKSPRWDDFVGRLKLPAGSYRFDARLIGYRGKERRPVSELQKFLSGQKSSVTRLDLKVCDLLDLKDNDLSDKNWELRRKELNTLLSECSDLLISHAICDGSEINNALPNYMTRLGAEIVSPDSEEKLIYVNSKRAPFVVTAKDDSNNIHRYKLETTNGDSVVPVVNDFSSRQDINIGDVVELELSAILPAEGGVRIIHPQLIDFYEGGAIDSIELLINDSADCPSQVKYSITTLNGSDILLQFSGGNHNDCLAVRNFSAQNMNSGRRFLADRHPLSNRAPKDIIGEGRVIAISGDNQILKLRLDGLMKGTFVLRPVVLNHVNRFLFYRLDSLKSKSDIESRLTGGESRLT